MVEKFLGESQRSFAAKAKEEVLEVVGGEILWMLLLAGVPELGDGTLELMTVEDFPHFEGPF